MAILQSAWHTIQGDHRSISLGTPGQTNDPRSFIPTLFHLSHSPFETVGTRANWGTWSALAQFSALLVLLWRVKASPDRIETVNFLVDRLALDSLARGIG